MEIGEQPGTGTALTVDAAARAFDALDSAEEHTEPSETLPPKAKAKAEPEAPSEDDAATAPEDDDEPTEDEGVEDDAPADDADESTEEDEQPAPRTHRVKVDGEEVEVTEAELHRGYSRTADYTRKTQALADARKAFEAEQVAVRDERKTYGDRLDQLAKAIADVTPQEPDWEMVRQQAPNDFPALYAQWQLHKDRVAEINRERERVNQQAAEGARQQFDEYLSGERTKLLDVIPAWKDAAVAKKDRADMLAYAQSQGFTDEELNGIADHRALVLLHKAMRYDRAQQARPNVVKKVEKVVVARPGSAKAQRAPVTEITRSKQRLAKTGRVSDAAALFAQLEG